MSTTEHTLVFYVLFAGMCLAEMVVVGLMSVLAYSLHVNRSKEAGVVWFLLLFAVLLCLSASLIVVQYRP